MNICLSFGLEDLGAFMGRGDQGGRRMLANATVAIYLILWVTTATCTWGQTLDYSVPPRPNDNFLEASFRCVIPPGNEPIQFVLVYVPGTDGDGRGSVIDEKFLALSKACHAAVLGCYFRGEGLSYNDPRGGSGKALDEALSYFAAKSGVPSLSHAKLLLVGFSEGGMFAFNYVCWRPERVRAFAAIRAMFPTIPPQSDSFQVPGLLAAGEDDEPGRIRGIASAFSQAEGANASWIFLLEKQSAHQVGRSFELASALFEAVVQDDDPIKTVRLDIQGKEDNDPAYSGTHHCWFPNRDVAKLWLELHRPCSWEQLANLADTTRLQDVLTIQSKTGDYSCPNGQRQLRSLSIASRTSKVTLDRVVVTGKGFELEAPSERKLPMRLTITFAPEKMVWGPCRGDLMITGKVAGHAAETFHLTLYATVTGPVVPVPSIAYLGSINSGQSIDQTILLKCVKANVRLAKFDCPFGISATVDPPNEAGDMPLHIHWLAGSRLGRMDGVIAITVTDPAKGVLHIPLVGFVSAPTLTKDPGHFGVAPLITGEN